MRSEAEKKVILKRILQTGYLHRDDPRQGGDEWRSGVLDRIAREACIDSASKDTFLLEHLLWKMAPVMGMLIGVISVYLYGSGFSPGYDSLQWIRWLHYTPEATSILQFFTQ